MLAAILSVCNEDATHNTLSFEPSYAIHELGDMGSIRFLRSTELANCLGDFLADSRQYCSVYKNMRKCLAGIQNNL